MGRAWGTWVTRATEANTSDRGNPSPSTPNGAYSFKTRIAGHRYTLLGKRAGVLGWLRCTLHGASKAGPAGHTYTLHGAYYAIDGGTKPVAMHTRKHIRQVTRCIITKEYVHRVDHRLVGADGVKLHGLCAANHRHTHTHISCRSGQAVRVGRSKP